MFPYVAVAVAVLTSVLAFTLKEFAKHLIGKMLSDDKNKNKMMELKQNVKPVGRITSSLPNCLDEVEDIQNCTNLNKYNKGKRPIQVESEFFRVKQGSLSITYFRMKLQALSSFGRSDVGYLVSHKDLALKTIRGLNESDSDSDSDTEFLSI